MRPSRARRVRRPAEPRLFSQPQPTTPEAAPQADTEQLKRLIAGAPIAVDSLLAAQRVAGNRAVQRMLEARVSGSFSSQLNSTRSLDSSPTSQIEQTSETLPGHRRRALQVAPEHLEHPTITRAPAMLINRKMVEKRLDFVKMKRKNAKIGAAILKYMGIPQNVDSFGHWWTEIGDLANGDWTSVESYGWWPKEGVNTPTKLFAGVEGELNQTSKQTGTLKSDPHQGDEGGDVESFHPVYEFDDNWTYEYIRTKVTSDIKNFANNFVGIWNWRLGWGTNCQTFQKALKDNVKLHNYKVGSYQMLTRPQGTKSLEANKGIAGLIVKCQVEPVGSGSTVYLWTGPKPSSPTAVPNRQTSPVIQLNQSDEVQFTLTNQLWAEMTAYNTSMKKISLNSPLHYDGFVRVFAVTTNSKGKTRKRVGWIYGRELVPIGKTAR